MAVKRPEIRDKLSSERLKRSKPRMASALMKAAIIDIAIGTMPARRAAPILSSELTYRSTVCESSVRAHPCSCRPWGTPRCSPSAGPRGSRGTRRCRSMRRSAPRTPRSQPTWTARMSPLVCTLLSSNTDASTYLIYDFASGDCRCGSQRTPSGQRATCGCSGQCWGHSSSHSLRSSIERTVLFESC